VTRRRLWDRVVQVCCEEFYAPRSAPIVAAAAG
jgi:hypothetical protein